MTTPGIGDKCTRGQLPSENVLVCASKEHLALNLNILYQYQTLTPYPPTKATPAYSVGTQCAQLNQCSERL